MPPELVERYLALLGVRRRKPSVDALHELVRAQIGRVPFENVSKLYCRNRQDRCSLPGIELFLDGIENFNFGGTCYPNNFYLYQLLASLGYQAILCGADMSNPDVHLVSMVEVEKRQYLVDAGYAAPFMDPLPRDLDFDLVIELGRDRYVLEPQDEQGRSRLEMYRDGIVKHGYTAKPEPRRISDFDRVIADSFREEATFMNAILLARFFPGRSLAIHNLTVTESRAEAWHSRTVADTEELVQAVADNFGIPPEITREAVNGLTRLEDAWD